MSKKFLLSCIVGVIGISFVIVGCKGKTDRESDQSALPEYEQVSQTTVTTTEEGMSTQPIEPSQVIATEMVPPTAALPTQAADSVKALPRTTGSREMDIQKALKNAGLYTGAIDGKIGPKTKRAIEEFQKSKGLKVDGKVGPKTWAELEKNLSQ